MSDFGGVLVFLGALMGAVGVPGASHGLLQRGGGSMMRKGGYDVKFWAAKT